MRLANADGSAKVPSALSSPAFGSAHLTAVPFRSGTTQGTRLVKQSSFEMMVRACSSDLFRFAYGLCRDRWQAQDLVQDTFAAAWKARDSLRDDAAAKAWLFSIRHNESARVYQRKRLDIDDRELEDIPVLVDGGQEKVELENALSALPENYREPLLLQVLGGFSGREIAETMGISEQNVMTRLTRARQALQRLVGIGADARTKEL